MAFQGQCCEYAVAVNWCVRWAVGGNRKAEEAANEDHWGEVRISFGDGLMSALLVYIFLFGRRAIAKAAKAAKEAAKAAEGN
jgi:hypothetical protein